MNFEKQRDFPFELKVQFRLLHFVRDWEISLWSEKMPDEAGEKYTAIINTFYIPIQDGKIFVNSILWDMPGDLVLSVGENRFIQYAREQADLHKFKKEYQCY